MTERAHSETFEHEAPAPRRGEEAAGKVLLEMSMSLDGYVAGPDVSPEAPLGRGSEQLHEWMFAGRSAAESESFETDHFVH